VQKEKGGSRKGGKQSIRKEKKELTMGRLVPDKARRNYIERQGDDKAKILFIHEGGEGFLKKDSAEGSDGD